MIYFWGRAFFSICHIDVDACSHMDRNAETDTHSRSMQQWIMGIAVLMARRTHKADFAPKFGVMQPSVHSADKVGVTTLEDGCCFLSVIRQGCWCREAMHWVARGLHWRARLWWAFARVVEVEKQLLNVGLVGVSYGSYGGVFHEASTALLADERRGVVPLAWHQVGSPARSVVVVAGNGGASEWREVGDSCWEGWRREDHRCCSCSPGKTIASSLLEIRAHICNSLLEVLVSYSLVLFTEQCDSVFDSQLHATIL